MKTHLSVFPLDNSLGYIIHRSDMLMAAGLQRVFQAGGYDITPEQWGVLNRLWEVEGLHQSALAESISKDRHNMTRILHLLEKNGFVERRPDPGDRRRLNVYLTGEGKALKKKLIPIVKSYLERCLKGLTREEIEALKRFHEHIIGNLEGERG